MKRRPLAGLVLLVVLAGCGSGSGPEATLSAPADAPAPGPAPLPAAPSTTITTPAEPAATPESVPPDSRLAEAGDARQAVVVTAGAYRSSTATVTAWERTGGRWRVALGPWPARIGRNGFAPVGEKREGDGRTPSGAYGFGFFFGVSPNPGVRFEYRQVPDDTIVWDEEPSSPTYNTWIDLDDYGGGHDPEGMYQPLAYRHGAVIAYNSARTPGLGSGIFLHATTGGPTAGCVALPVDQLVSVLRWLDPAAEPRIVLGVAG